MILGVFVDLFNLKKVKSLSWKIHGQCVPVWVGRRRVQFVQMAM